METVESVATSKSPQDDELLESATPEALLEALKLQGIFDSLRESIVKQLEQSVRAFFLCATCHLLFV